MGTINQKIEARGLASDLATDLESLLEALLDVCDGVPMPVDAARRGANAVELMAHSMREVAKA